MNKHLKITVIAVMAAALALILFCTLNYMNLGKELRSCEERLAESRAKWESIAAEKEALQDDLKAKQKELNIAQLELDNLTGDAEKLKAEIELLRTDIETLKNGKAAED